MPVWRLVPLPHICAAALRASTLLPNWTRCVVVNKFTHNATSRGSVLSLQKPNGYKNVLFFVPVWRLVPLPHNRAAALRASTLLLGVPAKELLLWGVDA